MEFNAKLYSEGGGGFEIARCFYGYVEEENESQYF